MPPGATEQPVEEMRRASSTSSMVWGCDSRSGVVPHVMTPVSPTLATAIVVSDMMAHETAQPKSHGQSSTSLSAHTY